MNRALIFDCDGVLGDTESEGHRVAFNQMWREFGVPWQWSFEAYGRMLRISGGKERLMSLFADPDFLAAVTPPNDPTARQALVHHWHRRKTAIFQRLVQSGGVPPRPGIRRLGAEALERGWKLAVASTSALPSVEAMLLHAMGAPLRSRISAVLAGDVVAAKKPAPDIYHRVAQVLDVLPAHCVVVEDSAIGLQAAVAAGMCGVVTVSRYTRGEDFSPAALVLDGLGDPGGEPCRVLQNRSGITPGPYLTVDDLERLLPRNFPDAPVVART